MIRSVVLVALLLAGSWAQAAELAFVINSNDASVSLIDVASHRELHRVALLREPHHMALTPDRRSLVIGDTAGNTLFFLDPRSGAIQRQVTVSDPYQLQYSPDGRYLTVAGLARAQIDIYDAASLKLLHRIPARSLPSHMNYAPDSSEVFVSLQGSDRLMAIETATGRVIWDSRVGRTPAGVLWNRGRLLVGLMGEAHFAVVDPVDGHVERLIPTGRGAHTMFMTHDQKLIYATNRVDGTLSVLDPRQPGRYPHDPRARRAGRPGFRSRRQDLGCLAVRTVGHGAGPCHRRHRAYRRRAVSPWDLAQHPRRPAPGRHAKVAALAGLRAATRSCIHPGASAMLQYGRAPAILRG